MTITQQEILDKQFNVRFRGFDQTEVDTFLEEVAEGFLKLVEENRSLQEKINALDLENLEYRGQEKALKNAVISAQKMAEEIKLRGQQEADTMLAEAREEALQTRDEAEAEIDRLQTEVDRIADLKQKAVRELQDLLQSLYDQLDRVVSGAAAAVPAAAEEDPGDLYQKMDLPEPDGSERFPEEPVADRLFGDVDPDEDQQGPSVSFTDSGEDDFSGPKL